MKFENKLDNEKAQKALFKALIEWELNIDRQDFATCDVLVQIPWELNESDVWEKWSEKIDEAIGGHKEWDTYLLFCDANYQQLFLDYIDKKLNNILKVYAMAIEDLNNKYRKCMVVEEFTHTDAYGFCQYKVVEKVYGKTYYDCICNIWEKYAYNTDWSFQSFVDACYCGNVHLKGNLNCHFGDKATNS